jgi:hypothetical protein
MPGSKTRFGFSGANEPLPLEGDAPDASRAARTIMGHETHRPGQAAASPPTPKVEIRAADPSLETKSAVPEPVLREEVTERVLDRHRHTGKSKFPAIARLLGRWTTGGGFLSRSRILSSDEALPQLPRNVWPSRIIIFLGAALLSFLIALAVMKVGHLE